ncbi:hypothetical protein WJX72_011931 [[Myrmecia] bisecta]|uniref:SnoaL-like domain-containing protein n=1 Tax=[Myrmecia] bisecta TaxID=41462 RepID=A0AAW1P3E7_9CHLO
MLDDSVTWQLHDVDPKVVPFGGRQYVGKEGMAQYFEDLKAIQALKFEAKTYYGKGDSLVYVSGVVEVKVTKTGKTCANEWLTVWRVEQGKVVSFDEYLSNWSGLEAAFSCD